jgi:hypothetical protein
LQQYLQQADVSRCSNLRVQEANLLHHLVGSREQRRRYGEAERTPMLSKKDFEGVSEQYWFKTSDVGASLIQKIAPDDSIVARR